MKSISMISCIPGGSVYPIVVVGIYFRSIVSIISSYVSWNLYTTSSRSLFFEFFKFSSISFLKVARPDKE